MKGRNMVTNSGQGFFFHDLSNTKWPTNAVYVFTKMGNSNKLHIIFKISDQSKMSLWAIINLTGSYEEL